MRQFIITIVMLCCITVFNGCKESSNSTKDIPKSQPNISEPNTAAPVDAGSSKLPTNPPADIFEITGTIVYKNLEGGFFAIDGDDGSKYDPINLPESFRKDGLKVKVVARHTRDAMSIHMYGAIIDIVEIAAK